VTENDYRSQCLTIGRLTTTQFNFCFHTNPLKVSRLSSAVTINIGASVRCISRLSALAYVKRIFIPKVER